ncbi:MAG: NADPH-dependent F420 reductase [Chloroflexi bacterium RBG_16_68_14]|nr:MAG: NADPH-dependent F420 reductase [Chloroflexi bacterium RBG_16_68_14]
MNSVRIGFIGGTGPEGKGLAYRFALAGHEVVIGSRSRERAEAAAREVAERVPKATVRGLENAEAARDAEVVVLTVPFAAQAETLPALREAIGGKLVISTAVPLFFDGGRPAMSAVPEGSAAEQAQALLPSARMVGAFQNLGAAKLWEGDVPLEQDIIVCADAAEAKRQVMALAEEIRGVRAVDGGPLASSRYVEGITVLLVGINRKYKTLAGVRIVGV